MPVAAVVSSRPPSTGTPLRGKNEPFTRGAFRITFPPLCVRCPRISPRGVVRLVAAVVRFPPMAAGVGCRNPAPVRRCPSYPAPRRNPARRRGRRGNASPVRGESKVHYHHKPPYAGLQEDFFCLQIYTILTILNCNQKGINRCRRCRRLPFIFTRVYAWRRCIT